MVVKEYAASRLHAGIETALITIIGNYSVASPRPSTEKDLLQAQP